MTQPLPRIPNKDNVIDRDFNYSEQDDYRINVKPYEKRGCRIVPIGEHRWGKFDVFAWKILFNHGNKW